MAFFVFHRAIRGIKDSFAGSERIMDQLSDADREGAWKEIEQRLSRFEGPNGFEAPGEVSSESGPSRAFKQFMEEVSTIGFTKQGHGYALFRRTSGQRRIFGNPQRPVHGRLCFSSRRSTEPARGIAGCVDCRKARISSTAPSERQFIK